MAVVAMLIAAGVVVLIFAGLFFVVWGGLIAVLAVDKTEAARWRGVHSRHRWSSFGLAARSGSKRPSN